MESQLDSNTYFTEKIEVVKLMKRFWEQIQSFMIKMEILSGFWK